MFTVNNSVIYSGHGVCRIVDITEQKIGATLMKYYVLKPIGDENSTLYVPVNNDDLVSKMHKILSAEEIYSIINSMPDTATKWLTDENMRRESYKEILTSGDRAEIMRAIKGVYLHAQEQKKLGRKLHIADERFMKDAEKLLYEEFAYVLNIKREDVLPLIAKQLDKYE